VNSYVINGRKWWSTGAGDPRCKIAIFMGKTDPSPRNITTIMILVPFGTPGVKVERMLDVLRLRRSPHGPRPKSK
jgi:acyl-CoA dehydrogenase